MESFKFVKSKMADTFLKGERRVVLTNTHTFELSFELCFVFFVQD